MQKIRKKEKKEKWRKQKKEYMFLVARNRLLRGRKTLGQSFFLTASSAEQVLGIAFQEEKKNSRHSVTFWKFLGISQCYIIRNRNIVENNQIK